MASGGASARLLQAASTSLIAPLMSGSLQSQACRCLPAAAAVLGRSLSTSTSLLFAQPEQQKETASTSGQQQQQPQQEATASSTSSSASSAQETAAAAAAAASAAASAAATAAFEKLKSGYEGVRSKLGDAAGSSSSSSGGSGGSSGAEGSSAGSSGSGQDAPRRPSLLQTMAGEVRATLLPAQDIPSATRLYTGPVMDMSQVYSGPTALVLAKQRQTTWQKAREALSSIPFLSKLKPPAINVAETGAYKRAEELAGDLRDKWETSDNRFVHQVEDVKAKLFTGSEASRAMGEVRTRNPDFDINMFVRSVKVDAPVVTKAFLKHDLATLSQHCGPELLQRFEGIFKHFEAQGLFEDPTILHVGEVEVVEVRLVDDDPFIIAQFQTQQLKCTRDRFGNVVEGSEDAIQRVFYFWGLQQDKAGVVTADGQVLPPRWVIKDMMWQSMLALV